MRRNYQVCMAVGFLMLCFEGPAQSMVVTDGYIYNKTQINSGTTSTQMVVGYNEFDGFLEINSEGHISITPITHVTSTYTGGVSLVAGYGAAGEIVIRGDGTANSAGLSLPGALELGYNGVGRLQVLDGGKVEAQQGISVGWAGLGVGGVGEVTVDGYGSQIDTDRVNVGSFDSTTGSLTVSNGGKIIINDSSNPYTSSISVIGGFNETGGSGSATIEDYGSLLAAKQLSVGGTLLVEDGGTVTSGAAFVTAGFSDQSGNTFYERGGVYIGSSTGANVTVTGVGSRLHVDQLSPQNYNFGQELTIGSGTAALPAPGTLTVNDFGIVSASNILVQENGVLNGNGGSVEGNVFVQGGTIAPGNSPGTLTIDGDLNVESGILQMEVESASSYDMLFVTGDIAFGKDAIVDLAFGYLPDNVFNFSQFFPISDSEDFTIDSGFDPLTNIKAYILADLGITDYSFTLNFSGGLYNITENGLSLVTSSAPVPEPSTMLLLSFGFVGLTSVARKRFHRSRRPCQRNSEVVPNL